jgi:hypothetical protein
MSLSRPISRLLRTCHAASTNCRIGATVELAFDGTDDGLPSRSWRSTELRRKTKMVTPAREKNLPCHSKSSGWQATASAAEGEASLDQVSRVRSRCAISLIPCFACLSLGRPLPLRSGRFGNFGRRWAARTRGFHVAMWTTSHMVALRALLLGGTFPFM